VGHTYKRVVFVHFYRQIHIINKKRLHYFWTRIDVLVSNFKDIWIATLKNISQVRLIILGQSIVQLLALVQLPLYFFCCKPKCWSYKINPV